MRAVSLAAGSTAALLSVLGVAALDESRFFRPSVLEWHDLSTESFSN